MNDKRSRMELLIFHVVDSLERGDLMDAVRTSKELKAYFIREKIKQLSSDPKNKKIIPAYFKELQNI